MGDPRKHRKKYVTPTHPWQRDRIEEERSIIKNFGLKNKKEIWRMQSILRGFKEQAKDLIKRTDDEAQKQQKLLMQKLLRIGIFTSEVEIEKILDLKTEDILKRRLQSVIVKQHLAHSMKQARQFIVHGHVTIDGQVVSVPSYIVPVDEEKKIGFKQNSKLADAEHPERIQPEVAEKREALKKAAAEEVTEEPKEEKQEEKPKTEKKEAPKKEEKGEEPKAKEEVKEEEKKDE